MTATRWPCYVVEARNHRVTDRAALMGAWDDEVGGFSVYDLVRVDTGEVVAEATYGLFLGDAPGQVATPGALWKVRHVGYRGPGEYHSNHAPMSNPEGDEDHWLVLTPAGGAFCAGCVSSGGAHWTVTGDGLTLTVQPSIHLCPGAGPPYEWHGWLTNGELHT